MSDKNLKDNKNEELGKSRDVLEKKMNQSGNPGQNYKLYCEL